MEEKLNSISSQLQALTNILVGDMTTLAVVQLNQSSNTHLDRANKYINQMGTFGPVDYLTGVQKSKTVKSQPGYREPGDIQTGNLVTRIQIEGGKNVVPPSVNFPEPSSSSRSGSFEPFLHPFSSPEFSVSKLYTAPRSPNQILDPIMSASPSLCSNSAAESESEFSETSLYIPMEAWINQFTCKAGKLIFNVKFVKCLVKTTFFGSGHDLNLKKATKCIISILFSFSLSS